MTERLTIPLLAERIERNKQQTDANFAELKESLRWLSRLVVGSAASIVVAIIVAVATRAM